MTLKNICKLTFSGETPSPGTLLVNYSDQKMVVIDAKEGWPDNECRVFVKPKLSQYRLIKWFQKQIIYWNLPRRDRIIVKNFIKND